MNGIFDLGIFDFRFFARGMNFISLTLTRKFEPLSGDGVPGLPSIGGGR